MAVVAWATCAPGLRLHMNTRLGMVIGRKLCYGVPVTTDPSAPLQRPVS